MARTLLLPESGSGLARYELADGEAFAPTSITWEQAVADPCSFADPAFPQVRVSSPSGQPIAVLEAPYLTAPAPTPVRPIAMSADSYAVASEAADTFVGMPYAIDSDAADPFLYDQPGGTWTSHYVTTYHVVVDAVLTLRSSFAGPGPVELGVRLAPAGQPEFYLFDAGIDATSPPGDYPVSGETFIAADLVQAYTLYQVWGAVGIDAAIAGTIVWTELTPPNEPYVMAFTRARPPVFGIDALDSSGRRWSDRGQLPQLDLTAGCTLELGTVGADGNPRPQDETLSAVLSVEDADAGAAEAET